MISQCQAYSADPVHDDLPVVFFLAQDFLRMTVLAFTVTVRVTHVPELNPNHKSRILASCR